MSNENIDVDCELERILSMMMIDLEEREEESKIDGEDSEKELAKIINKLKRMVKSGRLARSSSDDKVVYRLRRAIVQGKSEVDSVEFDITSLTAERFLKLPKRDKAGDFELGCAFVAAFSGLSQLSVGKMTNADMTDLATLAGFFYGRLIEDLHNRINYVANRFHLDGWAMSLLKLDWYYRLAKEQLEAEISEYKKSEAKRGKH